MDYVSSHLLVFVLLLSTTSNLLAFKMTLIHRSTIHSGKPRSNVSLHNIRGDIVPSDTGVSVFINMSIGNPPIPQLMVMDTGSSISWVQCAGCNPCLLQNGILFNPAGSTTYRKVPCTDSCSQGCDVEKQACAYHVEYGDGTVSQGILGTEYFGFFTPEEGQTSFAGVVFGCSYDSTGLGVQGGAGLLGLGSSPKGLASQLEADQFSYCIGNLSDKDYEYSHLIVGLDCSLQGPSTPLKVYGDHYYVTLEGISIGHSRFAIHESVGSSQDVMVDSGTTYSYLPSEASDAIWNEVKKFVGSRLTSTPVDNRLCYLGVARKDMKGFPVVRLHMADGAKLILGIESLFRMYTESSFCLTIEPATEENGNPPMIGLTAQQFHNVGYDLGNHRIHFERADCRYVDDY